MRIRNISARKTIALQTRLGFRKLLFEELGSRILLSHAPEECTLRAAIEQSNHSSGSQSITFSNTEMSASFRVNSNRDLSDSDRDDGKCWTGQYSESDVSAILPNSELPAIADLVGIYGGQDSNFAPLTEIVGSSAGVANGLRIIDGGSGSYIENLGINQFKLNGILLENSNDNRISGNFIGTNRTGNEARPNERNGIRIEGGDRNILGQYQWNVISGNKQVGVSIQSGKHNAISVNYIGTDSQGKFSLGNQRYGVEFEATAGLNIVGALDIGFGPFPSIHCRAFTAEDENGNPIQDPSSLCTNLISGNELDGVKISGASPQGSRVDNAMIGVDRTGNKGVPNGINGVYISTTPDIKVRGNRISGNTENGVLLDNAPGAQVLLNRIGTNFLGTEKLQQQLQKEGVLANGSERVLIKDNIISGNNLNGIHLTGSLTVNARISGNKIGMDITGDVALPNENDGILVDNNSGRHVISAQNLISGNKHNGIHIIGGSESRIQGNLIGTDKAIQLRKPNLRNGILIEGNASKIVIGVDDVAPQENSIPIPEQKNSIAGNSWSGIYLDSNVTNVTVAGNNIGVQAASPFGNGKDGITVLGPSNIIGTNLNGSLDDQEGNYIWSNSEAGVRIQGGGSHDNIVRGNVIGATPSDTKPEKVQVYGVLIDHAHENLVEANRIEWNDRAGLQILTSNGNRVFRNLISKNGNKDSISTTAGVYIAGAGTGMSSDNQIGGVDKGNTVVDNYGRGIRLFGNTTKVVGNTISRNTDTGVEVAGNNNQIGAPGKVIPGSDDHKNAAYGNTITENGKEGVLVTYNSSQSRGLGNSIRLNSIYGNGELGIDLSNYGLANGVTLNDEDYTATGEANFDVDEGANHLQNFPIIHKIATADSIVNGVAMSKVTITLNSKPNTKYLIDLYYVPERDSSNFGEGKEIVLSGIEVQTLANGTVSTSVLVLSSRIRANSDTYHFTSTATDPDGNTSEFSGRELKIFYGIDGTGSAAWLGEGVGCSRPLLNQSRWNSHTKNLYEELVDRIEYAEYSRGPNDFIKASDSVALHKNAMEYIADKTALINAQNSKVNAKVALAGWSRGAQIALWVANDLATKAPFTTNSKFEIDFVGLYDPVDMSPYIPNDSSLVRSRIDRVSMVGPARSDFQQYLSLNLGPYGGVEFDTVLGEYEPVGNPDWRFFVRQSHYPLYVKPLSGGSASANWNSGIHKADGNSRTILEPVELLNASHGSIGGTPGFNESADTHVWGEKANDGTNAPTKYVYATDVENSIKADRKIRAGFRAEGWQLRNIPADIYGFPPNNPDAVGCKPIGTLPPPGQGNGGNGPEGEGRETMAPQLGIASRTEALTWTVEFKAANYSVHRDIGQKVEIGPRVSSTIYTVELPLMMEREIYGPKEIDVDTNAFDLQFASIDELLSDIIKKRKLGRA